MKYKKKGSLTRKRSLLPKGTARRITHSFGMLRFPCTPYNLHGIALSTTVLYICRSRMKTRPTASHLTPRPHVLTPTCSQAHSHMVCVELLRLSPHCLSILTRKWLTHVYRVSIYQQIISPIFWDLVTGPISCELPNNVYNQLLMALCYFMITGPLMSVSAAPHLSDTRLPSSCTLLLMMIPTEVRGGLGAFLNHPFWTPASLNGLYVGLP